MLFIPMQVRNKSRVGVTRKYKPVHTIHSNYSKTSNGCPLKGYFINAADTGLFTCHLRRQIRLFIFSILQID